jgi:hypothetical protein
MNYDQALAIAAVHAPNLLVDPEKKGDPHICVRASESGPPFSIMLVTTDVHSSEPEVVAEGAEADKKVLTDALDAARKHFGV